MIKLEAVSERDEVSGLGTLQEDILPQAINLITCSTPHSAPNSLQYNIAERVKLGMIMAWPVVEATCSDVLLSCPPPRLSYPRLPETAEV